MFDVAEPHVKDENSVRKLTAQGMFWKINKHKTFYLSLGSTIHVKQIKVRKDLLIWALVHLI